VLLHVHLIVPSQTAVTFAADDATEERVMAQQWRCMPDAQLPDDFAPGDSLTLAWSADAQTLAPLVARDFYAARVHAEVLEPLVQMELDAPFGFVPGLAKSWVISADGLSVTYQLFPNAVFSDGRPVTADDVAFTWRTVMNPALGAAHLRSEVEPIVERFEKLDPHTVRFTLRQPYFDVVRLTGHVLPIIPKHVYGSFDAATFSARTNDLCIGSGPWTLDRWERGSRIVLKRNERYWGPKPALNEMVILIRPGALGQLQGFRAGEIDLFAPTPSQWKESVHAEWFKAKAATSFMTYSPSAGYVGMFFNMRRPALADVRVRQALSMLIDREAIAFGLREGFGVIPTGPFAPQTEQCNPLIEPWPLDRKRAGELLDAAGWSERDARGARQRDHDAGAAASERLEVSLLAPGGSDLHEGIARLIRQSFEREGVVVNIESLEWSMVQQRVQERTFDLVLMAQRGAVELDPYAMWHSSGDVAGGANLTGFRHARADEIMTQARRTLDKAARMKLWHELHAILHEQQPCAFLLTSPTRSFLDGRFRNVKPYALRLNPAEWYVPTGEQLRE